MLYEKIYLRDDDPDVFLTAYAPTCNEGMSKRPAVLILPGGAYSFVSFREGEPIAFRFLSAGVAAFVLTYSVGKKAAFPRPLIDVALAMKYIKRHAEEFYVDEKRVFVAGFSAGGHLAAAAGTLWHMDCLKAEGDDPENVMQRPAGMILVYPVISSKPGLIQPDSFYNLLGTSQPSEEELGRYSIEDCVDSRTVPAFLMHTYQDTCVPVANSLVMAEALASNGIPFELHVYPKGGHGLSTADPETSLGNPVCEIPKVAGWIDLAIQWLKETGGAADE